MLYLALLRGIMPSNPNMRSNKLKEAFEQIGFTNVRTVIGSGNVLFESAAKSNATLESKIENALPKLLGFKSVTIVRRHRDVAKLIERNPFKDVKEKKSMYPIVTFFKDGRKELCTAIDRSQSKTPDFMRELDKKYGKKITTRTWKTVEKIYAKYRHG